MWAQDKNSSFLSSSSPRLPWFPKCAMSIYSSVYWSCLIQALWRQEQLLWVHGCHGSVMPIKLCDAFPPYCPFFPPAPWCSLSLWEADIGVPLTLIALQGGCMAFNPLGLIRATCLGIECVRLLKAFFFHGFSCHLFRCSYKVVLFMECLLRCWWFWGHSDLVGKRMMMLFICVL